MSHKKERNSPEQKAERKKVNPRAEARYLRTSPQKARLVVDLIRGQTANKARIILRSTNKRMAPSVLKVLDSAIANAEHRANNVDVDELVVTNAYVNEGPRMKRIRPAPMGRAYRYQRRMAHITVEVGRKGQEWGSE
jgi:large subunit ribosomal protein L22